VQGVGFRPFVYNLARSSGLRGFVQNTAEGVVIEAEGASLDGFVHHLRVRAPVLARIDAVDVADVDPGSDEDFRIIESSGRSPEVVFVPPDVGTCDDCLRDVTQPGNRRYRYAFTNCTNCGPRYSIIRDVPYDRPYTTMAGFRMCELCAAEYHDPADRRFHAQPNACAVCGPRLSCAIEDVRGWLGEGLIVAVKGIGGYHLACDAANDIAVRKLRERKRRSDKPFAVMVRDVDEAGRVAVLTQADRESLASPRRPIVIVPRRPGAGLSDAIAPGNRTVGIFLPYTPLHFLLMEGFRVLVMTSGNLSEEPIVSREDELPRLQAIADRFLTHDRPIETRLDDSVVRTFRGRERVLRRSRGYAPVSIELGAKVAPVVACGGELKNTFCLTKDHYAILSQHIGDLENYETLEFFRETLAHMTRFFRIEPEIVAHDLHPDYLSTRFARELTGLTRVAVQHHHAHIASVMAENRLTGPVIGVAFDGTGYGTDGKVWGGEVLVADYMGFERRFHLRYVPLPGGDAAVREPWRVALSYLHDAFGRDLPDLLWFGRIPAARFKTIRGLVERGSGLIQTSSAGRLFDAVAAIAGVRLECNFEAQAAIELESIAAEQEDAYPFDISGGEIDFREAIRAIVRDTEPARISARFHNTLARAIVEACVRVRRSDGLTDVALSGGTFQNVRLLEGAVTGLERCGFRVHLHSEVPPNDGGLSLGQAVVAHHLLHGDGGGDSSGRAVGAEVISPDEPDIHGTTWRH
jgi:hydrogenase maturation protein HypF